MSCEGARALAQQFIDAAPEGAQSADEYAWEFRSLTRADMLATGLGVDFDAHARNIGLDPARSDLTRPVVVSIEPDEGPFPLAVWDGVHRIMSALARGGAAIPAVIGTRISLKPAKTARFGPPA